MSRTTEGPSLLRAWIREQDGGQVAVARRLGREQSTISRWASGLQRPDAVGEELLERVAGIPRSAWRTASERRALERAAKGAA